MSKRYFMRDLHILVFVQTPWQLGTCSAKCWVKSTLEVESTCSFRLRGCRQRMLGSMWGRMGFPERQGHLSVICDTTQIIPFPSLKTLSAWWLRFQKPLQFQCWLLETLITKQWELTCLEGGENLRHGPSSQFLKGKLQSSVDTIIWPVSSAWQLPCRGCYPGKPQLVLGSQVITTAPASGLPPRPLSAVNVVFWAPEWKGFLWSVEKKFKVKFLAQKVVKLTLKQSLHVNWFNDLLGLDL